jgi:hypothetical protein
MMLPGFSGSSEKACMLSVTRLIGRIMMRLIAKKTRLAVMMRNQHRQKEHVAAVDQHGVAQRRVLEHQLDGHVRVVRQPDPYDPDHPVAAKQNRVEGVGAR